MAGIASAAGTRTVTTNRSYDEHGRVLTSTDETGTTTAITYDDRFGLIGDVTITGADGSQSVTSHTLSADGTTIQDATTAYAEPGQPLTARTTTSYLYDEFGQPHQRTMTWAPGAKPAGDSGGPDTVVTTFDSAIDAAARTRTITTTTAVGTPDAAATTRRARPRQRTPGPQHRRPRPGHELRLRRGGPPDEHDDPRRVDRPPRPTARRRRRHRRRAPTRPRTVTCVLTTYDPLGRKARITDNVHDQAFTASPTARQLSAFSYSLDGTTTTATDQHGRTITTTLDVLGRQVQQVGATGITHTTAYDDAAHTTAQGVVPVGASDPSVDPHHHVRRRQPAVTIERDYGDGSADPDEGTPFDGLGRVAVADAGRPGPRATRYLGRPIDHPDSAIPVDPVAFPGGPLDLTSASRSAGSRRPASASSDGSASQGTRWTYDDAGRMATSTDPERSHDELHVLRRRTRRDANDPVRHGGDRHLRRHHRTADRR